MAPPGRYRLLWRRFRPHLLSWVGMVPFLIFALFPFYWMVVTSLKADANLYDLSRNPFWFSQVDASGRPYHKDIIVPASYSEGPIRWSIAPGAHTTRFDSEKRSRAHRSRRRPGGLQPGRRDPELRGRASGTVAHPNEVVGVIDVRSPSLTHYRYLVSTPFWRWMKVSLITGLMVVLITLIFSVPAAYGLARLNFAGNRGIGIAIFLTYLIPSTILFIPFSQFVGALKLDNSIWSLILSYPTFTIPFCTWLLMGFFRSVPKEIEERALLDGATRLQMLRLVVIPVVLPGILTAAIFAFTLSFQEYVYALTFISSTVNRTLPVGITVDMVRGDVYFWGPLMAAAVLGSVPVVIVYALSLDYFISGMTTGAVK